jgi:release factor glutamine methyltransferase
LLIADIGTGSGCIAIALAKELPAAKIYALDISAAALAVAQRNVKRLSAAIPNLANRITFLESNLLHDAWSERARPFEAQDEHAEPLSERAPAFSDRQSLLFDLIVSNPPYIGRREADSLQREVRNHEPAVALFGGDEGYEFYGELISQSAARLKPGGILVLELGYNSLPAVQPLLEPPLWSNAGITNDLAGIARVIAAEKT